MGWTRRTRRCARRPSSGFLPKARGHGARMRDAPGQPEREPRVVSRQRKAGSIPTRHAAVERRVPRTDTLPVCRSSPRNAVGAFGTPGTRADGEDDRSRAPESRNSTRSAASCGHSERGLARFVTRRRRPPATGDRLRRPVGQGPRRPPDDRVLDERDYLTVTVAPAPSRAALALSAASLLTFSRTVAGVAVDEVLGLLQAQAGEGADLLDDLDLLLAGRLEDDVELVLLLDLGRRPRRRRRLPGRRPRRPGRPR